MPPSKPPRPTQTTLRHTAEPEGGAARYGGPQEQRRRDQRREEGRGAPLRWNLTRNEYRWYLPDGRDRCRGPTSGSNVCFPVVCALRARNECLPAVKLQAPDGSFGIFPLIHLELGAVWCSEA